MAQFVLFMRGGALEFANYSPEQIQQALQKYENWARVLVQQGKLLLAGIAACHAAAGSYETTDWKKILFYYDSLLLVNRSPIIALNRAVAVAMLEGPRAGIAALDQIKDDPALRNYYLLPATYGELHERSGESERAAACYREALALMGNEAERRFLLKKLARCQR